MKGGYVAHGHQRFLDIFRGRKRNREDGRKGGREGGREGGKEGMRTLPGARSDCSDLREKIKEG